MSVISRFTESPGGQTPSAPVARPTEGGITRRAIYRLGGLGLAAAVAPVFSAAAAANWNCYSYVPTATLPPAIGWERIAKEVTKRTGGALKISYHLAGSLPINSTTISQVVSSGVMQLGDDGFYQGNVPIAGMLQLPMLLVTRAHMDKALEVLMPDIVKAYDKLGVVVLANYYFPLQTAWSKRKLESLADLKGQKMRVTSPEQAEFVRTFGGVPITLGADEVPSALDRGVVDGVFTASSGGARVWHDMLRYNYRLGPNYFNGFMIANKRDYDGLAAGTRDALKDTCRKVAPWITKTLFADEGTETAKLKAGGMVITPAKASDVKLGDEKLSGYWNRWAKGHGPQFVSALAKLRAAVGR